MDRLIFDAHAHYDDEKFDTDRDEIISSQSLQKNIRFFTVRLEYTLKVLQI